MANKSVKNSVYKILRRPRLTEKAAIAGASINGIVFDVHPKANKVEIKKAVEEIFEVKVKSVRTASYSGKASGNQTRMTRQGAWKKAYVSLQQGSSIDIIEGL